MDPHLIELAGPDELPGDVRAPHHHDILRCCGRLRLGESALDPVDDEGVGRTTLLDDHLPGVMGNDEAWRVECGIAAPGTDPELERRVALIKAPVPANCSSSQALASRSVLPLNIQSWISRGGRRR